MSETVFGKSREEEKVIILTEVQRMLNEYYPESIITVHIEDEEQSEKRPQAPPEYKVSMHLPLGCPSTNLLRELLIKNTVFKGTGFWWLDMDAPRNVVFRCFYYSNEEEGT